MIYTRKNIMDASVVDFLLNENPTIPLTILILISINKEEGEYRDLHPFYLQLFKLLDYNKGT